MARDYKKETEWRKAKYRRLVADIEPQKAAEFLKILESNNIKYSAWLENQIDLSVETWLDDRKRGYEMEISKIKMADKLGYEYLGEGIDSKGDDGFIVRKHGSTEYKNIGRSADEAYDWLMERYSEIE